MAKSAPKKSASIGKRTLIEPNGDKRYIRRDAKGRISESDDQGKSLSSDVKQTASTKVKPGQGDKGDQAPKKGAAKKAAPKKAAAKKAAPKKAAGSKQPASKAATKKPAAKKAAAKKSK